MNLLDKFHELCDRIGISPKVLDPILILVVAYVANGLISGDWNLDALKAGLGALLLAAVGIAAPAATGVTQREVRELAVERAPAKADRKAHLER